MKIYFAEFNKNKYSLFRMLQMLGFLEECFRQCVLGKDEKYSIISENFLDIWAGSSLSKGIKRGVAILNIFQNK